MAFSGSAVFVACLHQIAIFIAVRIYCMYECFGVSDMCMYENICLLIDQPFGTFDWHLIKENVIIVIFYTELFRMGIIKLILFHLNHLQRHFKYALHNIFLLHSEKLKEKNVII